MLSVAPSMRLVLADSENRHGGQPAWSPERALDIAHRHGVEGQIGEALDHISSAMQPAPYTWLTKRLGVLWTMFMAARDVDERALTVWMAETANLLADIPHDIVAFAIDEAIRKASHGFIPSVGEIRKHADPLFTERSEQVVRLDRMVKALDDAALTAERTARRADRQAHQRHTAEAGAHSQTALVRAYAGTSS